MNWWQRDPISEGPAQMDAARASAWWKSDPVEPQKSVEDMMVPTISGSAEETAQREWLNRRNGVLSIEPKGKRFGDVIKPIFGGHNPIAETYDAFIEPFVPSKPTTQAEADRQAWASNRKLSDRGAGAVAFAASLPVRTFTQGEYGAGDALKAFGFPAFGQSAMEAENNFARANAPQLGALAAAGSVGAGLTGINTARIASPTMPRDYRPSLPIMRAAEATRDAAAFDALNVRPFGPAFSQGPVQGLAKSVSDTPVIGGPLRNALDESIAGAGRAAEDVASRFGAASDARQAGAVAQGGLQRFRDARPQDTVDSRISLLSDAEISGIIARPTADTSLKTKQAALYEQAWRFIPEEKRRGKSDEGEARVMGNPSNTRAAIDGIVERNARMTLQSGQNAVSRKELNPVQGGLLRNMIEAVQSGKWTANYQTMRDMRSEFRRLASGMGDTERNTLRLSDLDRIQSALTQDMIQQLTRNSTDAAKRALEATMRQDHRAAQQLEELSMRYLRAVGKFKRADAYTRQSMERLETVERLFGASNVEALAQNISRAALDRGRGNQEMLRTLRKTLRPEEFSDIAAALIREMGRPAASTHGVARETGFSVSTFTTRWNGMTPEAKGILFGGEHAQALDDLARVAQRLAGVESYANTSNSARHATSVAGIAAAGGSLLTGDLTYVLGAAGGGYGASLLLSRPAYARWAVGYARARAAAMGGSRAAIAPLHMQVRRLGSMAKEEPELLPLLAMIAEENGLPVDSADRGSDRRSSVVMPKLKHPVRGMVGGPNGEHIQ